MKTKVIKLFPLACLALSLVSCTKREEKPTVDDQVLVERQRLMETYILNTYNPDVVAVIAMKHALPRALVDQLYAQNDPTWQFAEVSNIFNATNIQQLHESEDRLHTSPVNEQVTEFSTEYKVPKETVAAALFDVLLFVELKNMTSDY